PTRRSSDLAWGMYYSGFNRIRWVHVHAIKKWICVKNESGFRQTRLHVHGALHTHTTHTHYLNISLSLSLTHTHTHYLKHTLTGTNTHSRANTLTESHAHTLTGTNTLPPVL